MKDSLSIRRAAAIAATATAILAFGLADAYADEPRRPAADRHEATGQAADSAWDAMRKENERLAKEVALLRKENQALRRQLVLLKNRLLGGDGAGETSEGSGKTGQEVGEESEGLKYSISTNRIRHNSNCRYYNPAPDKACSKEDGRPCKACGG